MRDKGYIKLSRKFFSNRMWNEARVFSECEAWLDLIQSARFEATVTIEHIGGREVSYTRGQYPAAVSFLLKRWGWSSDKKVRNFLDRLKREGMITTDSKQGMNVITLCKYDEYNSTENAKGEPKGKGLGNSIEQKINELAIQLGELKARQKAIEGQAEGNNKKKVNKEKKEDIILSDDNIPDNSSELPVPTPPPDVGIHIPFLEITKMWNTTCTGYQQVLKLGDKRKNKIRIRIDEMGGLDKAIPMLQNLFDKMQASKFLRGESSRGWKADLDWLFANDNNWVKVLEGKYDNETKNVVNNGTTKINVGIDADDDKAKRDRDFAEHIRSKLGSGD